MMLPEQSDGGFVVLDDEQIGNPDLVAAIKNTYPRTRIYAQKTLSREARAVLAIGNPPPGPTGMLGYVVRNDATLRAMTAALAKMKPL